MSGYALGLIETKGKLAAVEAADVALKAANVTLCGFENATGALITVKIEGDVGAVKAAVEAARARAMLLSEIVATHVIPRPSAGLRGLIAKPAPAPAAEAPQPLPVAEAEAESEAEAAGEAAEPEAAESSDQPDDPPSKNIKKKRNRR
jgi:microcompartment protein CcmL/EutN